MLAPACSRSEADVADRFGARRRRLSFRRFRAVPRERLSLGGRGHGPGQWPIRGIFAYAGEERDGEDPVATLSRTEQRRVRRTALVATAVVSCLRTSAVHLAPGRTREQRNSCRVHGGSLCFLVATGRELWDSLLRETEMPAGLFHAWPTPSGRGFRRVQNTSPERFRRPWTGKLPPVRGLSGKTELHATEFFRKRKDRAADRRRTPVTGKREGRTESYLLLLSAVARKSLGFGRKKVEIFCATACPDRGKPSRRCPKTGRGPSNPSLRGSVFLVRTRFLSVWMVPVHAQQFSVEKDVGGVLSHPWEGGEPVAPQS